MPGRFILRIPQAIYDSMVEHARAELPDECVGMLVGSPEGQVKERYALVNELKHPERFLTEPRSMLAAEKRRRAGGYEVLAIYHSHPTSRAVPSRHDLQDHYSDGVMCLIVSLATEPTGIQGWWLGEGPPVEGVVVIADKSI